MLADRVSALIAHCFDIPPPPTIAAQLAGGAQIAFSHFKSDVVKSGLPVPFVREDSFVLNVPLKPARYSTVSADGIRRSVDQLPGEAHLFDLAPRNEFSLDTCYDSVWFHIPQSSLDNVSRGRNIRRTGSLRVDSPGVQDLILHHLALTILPVIENTVQVTTAFIESIARTVCEHVVHAYGVPPGEQRESGGLAPWQIRRACDFIEAHLANDPTIAALSKECNISSSHFGRAFRASLGMTPHTWIVKRRVFRAKTLMLETNESLAAVAFLCGFVDQSHLGRHFLKEEGQSPAQWRRKNTNHH